MDQDDTYRVLKRVPFEEIQQHLDGLQKVAPIYCFGRTSFESKKHELVFYYERIKCLEKLGWSFEEFVLETERRNIIEAIDLYNEDSGFPMDLVKRAKEFFPNAKFIQARIELE